MSCEYCQQDDAGNLKRLRDQPDNSAWLEESIDGWGIVASVTTRCCGRDCTTEYWLPIRHCPMCGRKL